MERLSLTSKISYNATEAAIHMARYQVAAPYCAGKRILDVACGEGYGSYALKLFGAAEVDGVDNSPQAIDNAQALFSKDGIRFCLNDAEHVDELFTGQTFDVIVSLETIEHVRDPKQFLQSIKQLASKKSVIIISCPNDHWYYATSAESNPYHLRKYSFEEFRELTTSVLGSSAVWGFGTPVVGFGTITDELTAGREPLLGQIAMLDFRQQASAITLPPRELSNVGLRNCSYFVGVWGGSGSRVYTSAVVPISMNDYSNLVSWETARLSPTQIGILEQEKSVLLVENQQLEQAKAALLIENQQREQEQTALLVQNQQLAQTKATLLIENQQREQQCAELLQEHSALLLEKQEREREHSTQELERQRLDQRVEQTLADNAILLSDLHTARSQASVLIGQLEDFRLQRSVLDSELQEIRRQHSAQREETEGLRTQHAALATQNSAINKDLQELRLQNGDLERSNVELARQKREAERNLEGARIQVLALGKELQLIEGRQRQIPETLAKLEQVTQELAECKSELEQRENELAALRSQHRELLHIRQERERYRVQAMALGKELALIRSQLGELRSGRERFLADVVQVTVAPPPASTAPKRTYVTISAKMAVIHIARGVRPYLPKPCLAFAQRIARAMNF